MMERMIEYLANALWQLPLLAMGAWWFLRVVQAGPVIQHRAWVAVLVVGVLLPLAHVRPTVTVRSTQVVTAGGELVGRDRAMSVRMSARSSETGWLRRRSVQVSAGVARWMAGTYFFLAVFGFVRIVRGWMAARRLVREGEPLGKDGSVFEAAVRACGVSMGVEMPHVLMSAEVSSPAIVGAWSPVLLVPETFRDYGHEEMRAALLHEMAHIRRRDYAANVLCEMAAVPLVWHPVVHAVQSRIRSTREMVCDAIAAGEMGSAMVYARSLLGLAGKAFESGAGVAPLGVGLFTSNNLEERVMRLTETQQAIGERAKLVRGVSAAAAMAAVLGFAAMVHLTPAMAQTTVMATAPQEESAPSKAQASPDAASEAQPASSTATNGQQSSEASVATTPVQATTGQTSPPADSTITATGHGLAFVTGKAEGTGASSSDAVGMAKGTGATVEAKEGYWRHQWSAADGEPFQMMNREETEPTPEERKRYEAEFAQRQAAMEKQMAEAEAQLNSAEFKQQMAELNSAEFKRQMAAQLNEMKKQAAAAKLGSKKIEREMAETQKQLNSPEMRKQLAELSSGKVQAEIDAQMATMKAQIDATVNEEVQKVRLKDTEERLEQTQKELDEARKELQAQRLKQKDSPEKP